MTWMRGADDVNALLDEGRVERVQPDDAHARHLWQAADAALHVAGLAIDIDASSAFENAYTAARKACTALMAAQGLRPTKEGGHLAVERVVLAQFGGVNSSFERYGRLRRRRNESEYPSADTQPLSADDAAEGLRFANAIVQDALRLLDSGGLSPF